MLSTVGVELTNFINTELSWKKVTKGFRSASRRSRKPARSLNVGGQPDNKSIRSEESSVSESEKLGVAVLGRRFADKIEHVPIKKRRLLLRSPSPPPRTPSPLHEEALSSQPKTPSPRTEDSDQTINGKWTSDQCCCSDSVSHQEIGAFNGPVAVPFRQAIENGFVNRKPSDVNGNRGCTEDFSGIALLAAAACNNSISDAAHNAMEGGPMVDKFLTTERIDSSISAKPLERTIISLETGSLLLKDSAHEDNTDGSPVQDYSAAVSQNFPNKTDCVAGERPASMKDERLHWDLNTVMEAWEVPCDDLNISSQISGSECIPDDLMHSKNPEKLEGGVRRQHPELALEQLKYSTADAEVSTVGDNSLDNSPCPGSDPSSSRPVSEEKINTSPTNVVMHKREDCCGTSAMQLGKTVSIENVHLGKHNVILLDLAVSEEVVCEIDSLQTKEDSRKTSCLPDYGTTQTELISPVSCQMSDVEYSVSESGPAYPSPEHETLPALGNIIGGVQPVVAVDVEEKQDKEAPTAGATLMDSSMHVEPKVLMSKSYEFFGKIPLEDLTDDGYGSDISRDGHGLMVGVETVTEIQAGYESPIEDGELRESVVCSLEENEVEGETECVDYDSDNRDADDFVAANHCMSEVGSDSCQNVDNGGLAEKVMQCKTANVLKDLSHLKSSEKFSGQDQLPEGSECSTDKTAEASNVSTQKVLASDSLDGLDVKGSSAGEVGSRATRGKLLSQIGGPPSCDALYRKDTVYPQRNSYDSCLRAERVYGGKSFGRDRPALRMQDGSRGDAHQVDSPAGYWDSRNPYPTGYHDPRGTGRPRPRSVIANSAAKVDGLNYRDQRRCTNYSSKGFYRPLITRRSPADNDDDYSVHRRMAAARDNSHSRSRGRSGIYYRGFIRGPREECHGPVSDDPASSSVPLPHYLARRERSFSPIFSRGRPRRNSQSPSRSPIRWYSQRERNMGVRRLSRSPDFRSEARMERVRMPFQKPNFEADEEDVFMSPPRSRFSPLRYPRWIDDENCVGTGFRERKSPGRFFGRSQRFDSVSSRRIKSEDHFRSMVRPERFTELSGGAGREHKYDCSDSDRMKHGARYEMIHRTRHCDTSGVVRRFRYDAEDSFEVHDSRNEDSCIRGTDRRDVRRSAREVRGPYRFNNNERTYAASTKLSGIRGYDEDASPSRA